MEALIAMLLVSCLVSQALCQDVEIRGTQDKVRADGGQRGTIYNQRHLSPHRMMHFGKRPANMPPPLITSPQVYDLYQERPLLLDESISKYPYLLYLELERGKTLQSLPDELPSLTRESSGNIMYNLDRPELKFFRYASENNNLGNLQQVVGKPAEEPRFLKLINGNELDSAPASPVNSNEAGSAERAQPSTNSQEDSNTSADQTISVSSRSIQSNNIARTNSLNLPKAYISSLFSRQASSSLPSYGLFNKKAEPKDNYFMHFGRK